ncbi:MAG: hypothetical protein AB7F50_08725 [Fimbriimonadaceae bacterium]
MAANLRVGADFLPRSGEAFPRVVATRSLARGWEGAVGVLSRRTTTEEGDLGVLGQVSWSVTDRLRLDGGGFQEFGGNLRPVAGARYGLSQNLAASAFYDGQFVALTATWQEGPRDWSLTRTGTGRLSLGLSFGF